MQEEVARGQTGAEAQEDLENNFMDPGEDETMEVGKWLCSPNEESESCTGVARPKTLFNPMLPTAREVAEHELTHRPYRNWCKVCVETRAREEAHRRVKEDTADSGVPEVGLDYDYYGDAEDSPQRVTTMIMKDRNTRCTFGNVCEVKGPGDA